VNDLNTYNKEKIKEVYLKAYNIDHNYLCYVKVTEGKYTTHIKNQIIYSRNYNIYYSKRSNNLILLGLKIRLRFKDKDFNKFDSVVINQPLLQYDYKSYFKFDNKELSNLTRYFKTNTFNFKLKQFYLEKPHNETDLNLKFLKFISILDSDNKRKILNLIHYFYKIYLNVDPKYYVNLVDEIETEVKLLYGVSKYVDTMIKLFNEFYLPYFYIPLLKSFDIY